MEQEEYQESTLKMNRHIWTRQLSNHSAPTWLCHRCKTVSTLTLFKGTGKLMTFSKYKLVIGIIAGLLLAADTARVAKSQTNIDDTLITAKIFQRAKDAYASLSSYSDEGKTVSSFGTSEIAPTTFSIKLARPNLYRIEWQQRQQ